MTITIPFWIIPVAGFICGAIGAMTFDLLNRKKKCNHTALIDKETIRAEIERRISISREKFLHLEDGPAKDYHEGRASGLCGLLAFLDTLEAEERGKEPATIAFERLHGLNSKK